jgi:putative N6-adenine-specific DNA methylase
LLYRANYRLRTALRVLTPIRQFKARHDNTLYRQVQKINWEDFLALEDTFAIDATVHSPHFSHSKFAALRAKDAIVDQFRKKTDRRPSIDVYNPTLRLHLHISNENCTLSLDSSGDALYKRGYRLDSLEAPINEVLAAGLVRLSGWQRDSPFVDPMCGSGTIPIEAALYAYNLPPQIAREQFGFMKWRDYDAELWSEIKAEAQAEALDFTYPIYGFDKNFQAIRISQHNALAACLEGKIEFARKPFERLEPPAGNGLIIMNPPYDERLSETNIEELYRAIGDRLKQAFSGYEAWIISSNLGALKRVGLRPSRKLTLFNGPLECKFQKYELYEGSRS